MRDTARGQAGIRRADGATIYRNVDAALTGVEIGGDWRFAPGWSVAADVAYVHAENLDDNRAIAQIPPLNGKLAVAYTAESWGLGGRMRWAATQNRVDSSKTTGSGLDAGKTSGYAVFDLYGSYKPLAGVELQAGVSNLFDHTYAEHLNRPNAFDPSVTQVYEPGRSLYMRAKVAF